jgi:Cdc6-like AAA superfamily ATPase
MCVHLTGRDIVILGTGKTATVLACIQSLERLMQVGQLPSFVFLEINCLRMRNPTDACKLPHASLTARIADQPPDRGLAYLKWTI